MEDGSSAGLPFDIEGQERAEAVKRAILLLPSASARGRDPGRVRRDVAPGNRTGYRSGSCGGEVAACTGLARICGVCWSRYLQSKGDHYATD